MARHSILVGLDGSASSEAALEWAAHEASRRGVGLYLVHVFPWSLLGISSDPSRSIGWEGAQQLVADARRAAEKIAPGLHVRTKVVTDSPAAALVQRSADAGLVVLGARGRGGFRELLAGSVALQVAGHAACPVVLVRAGWRPPVADREIVVGVGADAGAVLAEAFAEAELRGIRLRAIRAWRPVMGTGPTGMTPMGETPAELERYEEKVLRRALAPMRQAHPDVRVVESVVCDSARHALAGASAAAELLVIGARDHFGLHALALGTTAHAVVHHAVCPVLVARATGDRAPGEAAPAERPAAATPGGAA